MNRSFAIVALLFCGCLPFDQALEKYACPGGEFCSDEPPPCEGPDCGNPPPITHTYTYAFEPAALSLGVTDVFVGANAGVRIQDETGAAANDIRVTFEVDPPA